ncbi:hypothetical protein DBR11_28790 [Pedobacter sp. HMWF019]|uniref:hypothetical protein n=1 Tax=Pedobacter sp. HMWF019 TaxID=2056856 RepID=UPI000D373F4D|nr:hypothetical protein [Pedobacter sp. HMWF019]PTS91525.1 hypothetical protein DBR11_28790 [Pedobacter sp. HMWF019]
MENSSHDANALKNAISQIGLAQDPAIQHLLIRKAEIEDQIHKNNEKLNKLIQASDQLLHPDRVKER